MQIYYSLENFIYATIAIFIACCIMIIIAWCLFIQRDLTEKHEVSIEKYLENPDARHPLKYYISRIILTRVAALVIIWCSILCILEPYYGIIDYLSSCKQQNLDYLNSERNATIIDCNINDPRNYRPISVLYINNSITSCWVYADTLSDCYDGKQISSWLVDGKYTCHSPIYNIEYISNIKSFVLTMLALCCIFAGCILPDCFLVFPKNHNRIWCNVPPNYHAEYFNIMTDLHNSNYLLYLELREKYERYLSDVNHDLDYKINFIKLYKQEYFTRDNQMHRFITHGTGIPHVVNEQFNIAVDMMISHLKNPAENPNPIEAPPADLSSIVVRPVSNDINPDDTTNALSNALHTGVVRPSISHLRTTAPISDVGREYSRQHRQISANRHRYDPLINSRLINDRLINNIRRYNQISFASQSVISPPIIPPESFSRHQGTFVALPISTSSSQEQKNTPEQKSSKIKAENNLICIICDTDTRNVVHLPCGHLSSCEDCHKKMKNNKCPLCRATIQTAIKIFT